MSLVPKSNTLEEIIGICDTMERKTALLGDVE
jgi:hypothetical protein